MAILFYQTGYVLTMNATLVKAVYSRIIFFVANYEKIPICLNVVFCLRKQIFKPYLFVNVIVYLSYGFC